MHFPVSIKGVLVEAGRVVLLENERDEWELPGGRLARRNDYIAGSGYFGPRQQPNP